MRFDKQKADVTILYVDLNFLLVQIRCNIGEILTSIKALFGGRATYNLPRHAKMLECNVIFDKDLFKNTFNDMVFNGPSIEVNRGINSCYALESNRTRFAVSKTAILELNHDRPDVANVYLDPESYMISSSLGFEGVRAEPEAFFYPLMTEWLRNFDACLMHCGAVAAGDQSIVLSGPPGSGKSTHILRMVNEGLSFLADDLVILHRHKIEGIQLFPFREVSNVHSATLDTFPELQYLKNCPRRGDGKYCVDIFTQTKTKAVSVSKSGAVIRLFPDQNEWIRPCPDSSRLNGIHAMAFFVSRPYETREHFHLLCDFLMASKQWEVSQGYLRNQLNRFIDQITKEILR